VPKKQAGQAYGHHRTGLTTTKPVGEVHVVAVQDSTTNTRKRFIRLKKEVMALVVMLLLLPVVSHALSDEQEALVGLRGVYVVIGPLRQDIESLGLNSDQIKTDIELRLRKAGIRVLAGKEMDEVPGKPYLYVNVDAVTKPGSSLCAYSIKVQLAKNVPIESGSKIPGVIWQTTGYAGTANTCNTTRIHNIVGDLIDHFINDYLAANPKK
jgi:hypothetical protein